MNNINIISNILNLNLKKYKILSCNIEKENILEFHIKWIERYCTCPQCWLKTDKRQDLKEYKQKKNLKHIIMSDWKIIEIKPIKRFFKCINCKSEFLERFDFESSNGFHTHDFEKYVISSWGYLSWPKIAELSKSNVWRIYNILNNIDTSKLNENWLKVLKELDEIYLWIDEHSFSWNNMILIITELKTKKLIALLPKITKESLDDWIKSLPLKIQIKVKWFSTDMNKWYRNSLKNIVWNPDFSVDKYHLFQEANRVVDDVRQLNLWLVRMNLVKIEDVVKYWKSPKKLTKKDISKIQKWQKDNVRMKKYKEKSEMKLKVEQFKNTIIKNKKGVIVEYSEITQEYYEEKWYKRLFSTREKNLSPFQKIRLNQIFRDFDYNWYLAESWNIKEDFMNAIDEKDITKVDEIILECRESEHHRLQQFARTLNNWHEWIDWYCKHSTEDFKFTNAFTEGYNNKCKNIKRQGFWFKIKDNYFKKIWIRELSKKSNLFSHLTFKKS